MVVKKWLAYYRTHRRSKRKQAMLEQMINPVGATCVCAKSSAVWCRECEGNKRQ